MIEVENLSKRYGEKLAVDGLDFVVQPGIVTGFLVSLHDLSPVPLSDPAGSRNGNPTGRPDRACWHRQCLSCPRCSHTSLLPRVQRRANTADRPRRSRFWARFGSPAGFRRCR
jgi:hypothetical protein